MGRRLTRSKCASPRNTMNRSGRGYWRSSGLSRGDRPDDRVALRHLPFETPPDSHSGSTTEQKLPRVLESLTLGVGNEEIFYAHLDDFDFTVCRKPSRGCPSGLLARSASGRTENHLVGSQNVAIDPKPT